MTNKKKEEKSSDRSYNVLLRKVKQLVLQQLRHFEAEPCLIERNIVKSKDRKVKRVLEQITECHCGGLYNMIVKALHEIANEKRVFRNSVMGNRCTLEISLIEYNERHYAVRFLPR